MIKVTVRLENDLDSRYDVVEITKEDILQLACEKAKDQYTEGAYNNVYADDEIKIEINR